MKLTNTLTRRKELFSPRNPAEVGLYTCGPTVYHYAHIGNLRTYVFEDILRRALEFTGYTVKHVMNITDVGHLTSDADDGEDKMAKGARREKKTVWEIAEFYTRAFLDDAARLNLLHPHVLCKATDHIPEMIAQIRLLEANGHTYTANGNVYFDTSTLPHYGELAHLKEQELQAGARIEVDPHKKHPHDFALWFTNSKFGNQDMQWESPWGKGFPGWHIECSAMSTRYLGETFDIHCGGIDHIPVHHTNEIAQAEGALKVHPWVRTWLHGNFLVLKDHAKGGQDSAKMAKSGDNFLTLSTLAEKGFDPLDYRYFCLQAHYSKELVFSWEALTAARGALRRLREKIASWPDGGTLHAATLDRFSESLEDDLNAPQALALLWQMADDDAVAPADKKATALDMDRVLGLKLDASAACAIPPEVMRLAQEREAARQAKNWPESDRLRDTISAAGFAVRDLPHGFEIRPL